MSYSKLEDSEDTSDEDRVYRFSNYTIAIGAFSYGINKIEIRSWGGNGTNLKIGRYCSVAKNLKIFLGGNHRMDWITTYPFGYIHNNNFGGYPEPEVIYSKGDVEIGSDVWIGESVTILSGIHIGNGAVIGAGSVVTRDVLAYELVAGNPIKHIRLRFSEEIIRILDEIAWWNLPLGKVKELVVFLQQKPSIESLEAIRSKILEW